MCRLNCRIHRKKVCLFCNVIDDCYNFVNLIKLFSNVSKNLICRSNLFITICNISMHFLSIFHSLNSHLVHVFKSLYNFVYSSVTVFNCLGLSIVALYKSINMKVHFCNYTNCAINNLNHLCKLFVHFINICINLRSCHSSCICRFINQSLRIKGFFSGRFYKQEEIIYLSNHIINIGHQKKHFIITFWFYICSKVFFCKSRSYIFYFYNSLRNS